MTRLSSLPSSRLSQLDFVRELLYLLLSALAREVPPECDVSPDEFRRQLALSILAAIHLPGVIEDAEAATAEAAADLYAAKVRALRAKADGRPLIAPRPE